MKVENINGKLPQRIQKTIKSDGVAKKLISGLSSQKEKDLATAIIDSVFSRIKDSEKYLDDYSIKQINLILGRTEDLLDKKVKTFSEKEKENVKDCILMGLKDISLTDGVKDYIETIIKKLLVESFDTLKDDIIKLLNDKKSTSSNNDISDSSDLDDENNDDEDKVQKNDESDDSDDGEDESETSKVKDFIKEQSSKLLNNNDSKLNKKSSSSEDKDLTEIVKSRFDDIKAFIVKEFEKLNSSIDKTIMGKGSISKKDLKQNKKKKSAESVMLKSVESIKESVTRILSFFENIGERVLEFFSKHIFKIAKILAKGLSMLFKPILKLFWLTIAPPLMIIAFGIFLILKAIAEHIPNLTEGINKAMEIAASAIPILVSAIPKFLDILLAIVDIVKTLVMFAIDELWPFIKDFFEWFKTDVYEPIIKPILVWLSTVFLKFFEDIIMPILGKILNWIVDTLMPFVKEYILPILGEVLVIIKEFMVALQPYIKPLVDIVVGTLITLFEILKPVIIELAKFLANVFMDLLSVIVALYKFISNVIIKPVVKFFTEVIPNFAGWIWKKIKSILPWGGDDTEKFELEEESKTKTLDTIEDYKAENQRLSNKIKELMTEAGADDLNKALNKQKKKLEDVRNDTIKIDKGTVYDILQIVNKINNSLIKILSTAVSLLDKIVEYFRINPPTEFEPSAINSDIPNQIANDNLTKISNANESINISTKELKENTESLKSQTVSKKEKKQEEEVSEYKDLKSFLNDMFSNVIEKLETPIPVPIAMPNTSAVNTASMENI